MKKSILLAGLLCLFNAHSFSRTNSIGHPLAKNKTVTELVNEKAFANLLQSNINMAGAASYVLQSPNFIKIKEKKATREEANQFVLSMGFKNMAEFTNYNASFKSLKLKYSNIFKDEKLLNEAIVQTINSKKLDLKAFTKKQDCLSTLMWLMASCDGLIALGSEMDAGTDMELLLAWVGCMEITYLVFLNCSGQN